MSMEDWKWYGGPGHFALGMYCKFRLCTEVNGHLISTVGAYYRNEEDEKMHEIGWGRNYETMVFNMPESPDFCKCGCGVPLMEDYEEIEMAGYNDAKAAAGGHMEMCKKYDKEN